VSLLISIQERPHESHYRQQHRDKDKSDEDDRDRIGDDKQSLATVVPLLPLQVRHQDCLALRKEIGQDEQD
jgi:hypothetical protein